MNKDYPEPFGYFRAEPFGWTDCAETDDGATPLFEKRDVDRLFEALAVARSEIECEQRLSFRTQLNEVIKQRDELLAALKGLHDVCEIALSGKDGLQYAYFETRAGHLVAAVDAMKLAESAIRRLDESNYDYILRQRDELLSFRIQLEEVSKKGQRIALVLEQLLVATKDYASVVPLIDVGHEALEAWSGSE